MKGSLDTLLDFIKFTHEIRNVKRAVILDGKNRQENDAEHGYQMAMVAWFLINNDKLKLDPYRCVGMALVHDVVEVHAGDTIVFAPREERAAQVEREKAAIKTLKKQWPSFTSLHELINEYEEHKTPEGKFVYALDKLLPVINNYMYGGKVWKRLGISLDELKKVKKGKMELSPEVDKYYQDFLAILEKNSEVFGNKKIITKANR